MVWMCYGLFLAAAAGKWSLVICEGNREASLHTKHSGLINLNTRKGKRRTTGVARLIFKRVLPGFFPLPAQQSMVPKMYKEVHALQ